MKKLISGLLALMLVLNFSGCGDSERLKELKSLYLNKKVPYSKFDKIGQPETLSGTNNSKWVAYFPKSNFTIVTDKKTDIVKKIYEGKVEQ